MASQLQEAITETRNGNTVEAQKILADILKADTENVQAWYLLALVVDSPEKKHAYLNRVLTLDPNHEKAKEAFADSESMSDPSIIGHETAVSPIASFEEPTEFLEDATLPSWLDNEKEDVPEALLIEEEPSEIFNAEMPDWLSNEATPVDIQDEPPTLLSESPPKELEAMLAEGSASDDSHNEIVSQIDTTQAIEKTETTAIAVRQPVEAASARPWNIALILLTLLTILTLLAIFFQLRGLF